MKKLLLGTSVLAGLSFAAAAQAADMPLKAPRVPYYYNWTGFYVGANVGAHWLQDGGFVTEPADAATATFWGPCFVAGACPRTVGGDTDVGIIGGFQAGYN